MIRTSSFFVSCRRVGLATAFLMFLFGGPARAASAPDWLSNARQVDVSQLGAGAPAVIVAEWTDFSVDQNGRFQEIERCALRILNVKAAEPYLRAVGYENNDESVVSIQTWAIPSSGHVIESTKKDVATVAQFSQFELFSDSRYKVQTIVGAEDGALVGYEIVRTGHLPLGGEKFRLEEKIPVKLGELHVSVPAGSLRWFVNYPDRVEVVNQSTTSVFLRVANRPAIPQERDAPPFESLATQVFANYDAKGTEAVGSWEEAGRAIHPFLSGVEKLA